MTVNDDPCDEWPVLLIPGAYTRQSGGLFSFPPKAPTIMGDSGPEAIMPKRRPGDGQFVQVIDVPRMCRECGAIVWHREHCTSKGYIK